MSGTTKKLQLLGKLQSSVYILSEGETLADAPIDADVVIDPYSDEAVFPEGGSGGAQSDWNAAEGEPGHVLNRPFYSEGGSVTLLEETTLITSEEADDGAFIPSVIDLTGISEIEVTYNGTKYVCPITVDDSEGLMSYYFGDLSLMSEDIESTGEPFVGLFFDTTSAEAAGIPGLILPLDGSTEFTVSIAYTDEVVTPIPKKYLTELRGQKTYVLDLDSGTASSAPPLMEEMDTAELQNSMIVIRNGKEYTVTGITGRSETEYDGVTYNIVEFVCASAMDVGDMPICFTTYAWIDSMVNVGVTRRAISVATNPPTAQIYAALEKGYANWLNACSIPFPYITMKSITEGSTKQFKITVDDNGTLTTTALS